VLAGVAIFALGGSWILLYVSIAVLNVLGAAWVIWTIRGSNVAVERADNGPGFLQSWLKPWRSRDFRWVFASSFLLALGFYLVQPYLQNYLRDVVRDFAFLGSVDSGSAEKRASAPGMATAVLALAISLSGAIGALVAARLSDRIGRKRVVYGSGIIMFVALVPFALSTNYLAILALGMFFGLGYGARLSAEWALVSDVLPDAEEAGKDMGVWQMSQSSVQILAGGAGAVIDSLNRGRMGAGYTASFILAAVLFVISTVLVKLVRGSR
jgi:MFS family permease